jgi:hypothetical protein
MKKYLYLILLILVCVQMGFAQKIMQIETVNKARSIRLHQGETLVFQLRDPNPIWEEAIMNDFDVEKQTVTLGFQEFKISEIAAIKLPKHRFVQVMGAQFIIFGISWTAATAIGDFWYKDDVNWTTAAIISGTSIPLGFLMLRPKKVKLGKRKRLRVLDISYPGSPEDLN